MSLRIWPPQRPYPAPVAGTFLSLTAHAVVLSALVGSNGSAPARAGAGAATRVGAAAVTPAGERLHWVGVGTGSGAELSPSRPGMRPPIAYVVPGRGWPSDHGPRGDSSRGHVPELKGPDRSLRRVGAGTAELPPPAPALRPPSPRPAPLPRRLRLLALPDVALPELEATLLVAGVLSAAPDLTRRVSRPEDFAPTPASDPVLALRTRRGVLSLAVLGPNVHVDELPIPLVSNPPPAYPAMLERARVGGHVVVEFMIDSTGVVDLGSLHVVQSTNTLFTQAVRRVLPQLRFMPAQLGERAVGVTVRQPFEFTIRAGW